jgi:2-dehydropantoate 2-reductase
MTKDDSMKALLVGAGAVGISYGYFLARGGADVAFLVKPRHAEALRAGTEVYLPRKRGVREGQRWRGYEVLTTDAEVASRRFDAVFLCMSATALRGSWLEPFLAALAPETTLVMLTPGAEDLAYLAARFPEQRIVAGLITLVAWQTPLPEEAPHTAGIAIWFPPMTKLPFSGPRTLTAPIVETLKRGGAPARSSSERIARGGPLASAVLTCHVAALQASGWTFKGLRNKGLAELAAAASRQGVCVLAHLQGRRPPMLRGAIRAGLVGLALRVAASQMPFDFEVYLRYHFTKVADQTDFSLRELARIGRDAGLEVGALERLHAQVFDAIQGSVGT